MRCPTRLATIQAAEPESQAPSERSCAWTGTVITLDEHLAQCLHAAVACPNTECKVEMKRLEAAIHDARCPHKLVDCPLLCNQPVKRQDAESHCSEYCPRRLVDCTNACGERILFQETASHATSCPLQEVKCPYFLAFACHETCTGRLRRKAIEDHIENKKTMASVITQMTSALAALQSNAPAAAANASAVDPGARQVAYGKRKRRSNMIGATSDAVIASRLRVVSLIEEIVDPTIIDDASKANLIAWCNQASLKTLATIQHQLLQVKPVEHQPWSTHHLALEIPYTTCPGVGFDISSTTVDLGDGVRVRLTLEFLANTKQCGRKTNCFVDLEGFRGSANFMVTALRPGLHDEETVQGVRESNYHQWECDEAIGWLNFFGVGKDAYRPWLSCPPERSFKFLVTLHLLKNSVATATRVARGQQAPIITIK